MTDSFEKLADICIKNKLGAETVDYLVDIKKALEEKEKLEQALDKACYFLEKSKFGTTCDEEYHKNCTENHCSTYCMHSRKMNKEEWKKYLMEL